MSWITAVMGGAVLLSLLAAGVLFYRFADAFFMGDQPQAFSLIAVGIIVTGVVFFAGTVVPDAYRAPVLVFEVLGGVMTLIGFVMGYQSSAGDLL